MRTWLELEARFCAMVEQLRHAQLSVQWGDAGERRELVGAPQHPKVREFVTLCGIAGRLLELSLDPESEAGKLLLNEKNPTQRWFLYLHKYSGAIQDVMIGEMRAEDGTHTGNVFSGYIREPAAVSANQCLDLEVNYPVRDGRKWYERVYDDYGREIVIGAIGSIITILLGLFFGCRV